MLMNQTDSIQLIEWVNVNKMQENPAIFQVLAVGRKLIKKIHVLIFIEHTPNFNSNKTSFFRIVNKRAIYRLGIISLAHAPVHVTDSPIVNVHVDELSSDRI
jgi:hypothetical protein